MSDMQGEELRIPFQGYLAVMQRVYCNKCAHAHLQKKCNAKDLSRHIFLSYEPSSLLSQGQGHGTEEGQADGPLQFEIRALKNKVRS